VVAGPSTLLQYGGAVGVCMGASVTVVGRGRGCSDFPNRNKVEGACYAMDGPNRLPQTVNKQLHRPPSTAFLSLKS